VASVLRAWIERLAGSIRGIYRAHIDDLRELAFDGPSNGSIDLPRGWKVLRNYNSLQLKHRQLRRAAVPYSIKLVGSGETLIEPAAIKIRAEVMSCRGLGRPSDLWEAHFDADSVEGPLTARNFKEGDRLVPLGMKGRRKVKDIFIDRKVPISLRRRVPLIVAGESIAWVPGIVRADVALLTPKTRRALRLVAEPFIASKTISVLAS
jgi:tRNA(Ile)-lysidine synthase